MLPSPLTAPEYEEIPRTDSGGSHRAQGKDQRFKEESDGDGRPGRFLSRYL